MDDIHPLAERWYLCSSRRLIAIFRFAAIAILFVGLLLTIRAVNDGAKMDTATAKNLPGPATHPPPTSKYRSRPPAPSWTRPLPPPSSPPSGSVFVYLGNGCFWERQWAYVEIETQAWHRKPENVSSKVGYAGGSRSGASGRVCYHCGLVCPEDYAGLGHSEVVQVRLDAASAPQQMQALAHDFFDSFRCTVQGGCTRPDPGDQGSAYRSVLGVPGGMDGPLFAVVAAANTHGMRLTRGQGDEGEARNSVLVYDSLHLPFHLGEPYHQFHSNFFQSAGMVGGSYPASYTADLWALQKGIGEIPSTGCPDGLHN